MGPLSLVELLAALDAAGIRLRICRDTGKLITVGPRGAVTPNLAESIRTHARLLAAHALGSITGHVLAFCDACGEPMMTAVRTSGGSNRTAWPACRLTPDCKGRHVPRAVDLAARCHLPAPPPQAAPPRRPSKQCLFGPGLDYPPIRPTNREQP